MTNGRAAARRCFYNSTFACATSYASIVQDIGEQMGVTVAPLPPELKHDSVPAHTDWFDFASHHLDIIAERFGLDWDIRGGVLTMYRPAGRPRKALSPFDEFAGKLWTDGKRADIGTSLDAVKFAFLENLEGKDRAAVGLWNQQNGSRGAAVHTWTAALACQGAATGFIRRAAQRRLSRAGGTYKRSADQAG